MQDQFYTKLISIAKIGSIVVSVLAIIIAFVLYQTSESSEQRIIAITQIAQHPSLDQIRQGITDELTEQGLLKNRKIKIIYENAQGNISTAVQIAQKFASLEPEVIVGITTPSAQTVHAALRGKDIPLVFSAVTDPIGANLVKDLDHAGEDITGTIDLPPTRLQLALLKKMVPNVKKIGVIYNPGEINSLKQIDKLDTLAKKDGIEIVKAPAFKSSEVYGAASKLAGNVQAIYLPNDNTVVSALDSVVRVANENHIPTLASDDQSIKHGILASLANNQYQVGRETGKLVARILHGESAKKMPVVVVNTPSIAVNEAAARKLKINIKGIKIEDLIKEGTQPKS